MTVIHLVTSPMIARESAILHLEAALEAAKAGELQSVAIAAVTSSGDARMLLSDCDRPVTLLGAVHAVAHMITEELL